jgi:hypothetical protein
MIKNIVILVLLGLFVWQHEQDTQDRLLILHYLQRNGQHVHVAYEPCNMPSRMKNSKPGDSVESPEVREQ